MGSVKERLSDKIFLENNIFSKMYKGKRKVQMGKSCNYGGLITLKIEEVTFWKTHHIKLHDNKLEMIGKMDKFCLRKVSF